MSVLLHTENGIHCEVDHDIAVVNFLSKVNCGSLAVLEGLQQAITLANQQKLKGIIIYQPNEKFFCVGADLPYVCQLVESNDIKTLRHYLATFQQTALACRYSHIPVVAAIRGYALGGGCELALHCAHIVAAQDSHIGLVETSIGLVPSGGGCKEMMLRAANDPNPEKAFAKTYLHIAHGDMSKHAAQAKDMGYLTKDDVIVDHADQVFEAAKTVIHQLTYQTPTPLSAQRPAQNSFQAILLKQYQHTTQDASEYDLHIAQHLAALFTSTSNGPNTEEELLHAELDTFMSLAVQSRTQERIQYTLRTGQHLHN